MTADLLSFVRRGIESVEELSEREEKQARAEGERYAETDVIKQYEEINKAREQYVKQGMSEEEAFKKAKEERLDMMKRSLKYEKQNLEEAVNINKNTMTNIKTQVCGNRCLELTGLIPR